MNRIEAKFRELRQARKKAFIAFLTAGYPSLKETEQLVLALAGAGADIIELGIPFSDPLADGPVIQDASYKALSKGVNLRKILAMVKRIRLATQVPIALMTYYNPVLAYGEECFVADAQDAGADGVIVPDLPWEEGRSLARLAAKRDFVMPFFLSPATSPQRMPVIARAATGFVYFVSVAGVTGSSAVVPFQIARQVRLAKTLTDKPVCVGFGVSTPGDVRKIARFADGVIVGSAIIREINKYRGRPDMVRRVAGFVRALSKVPGQHV
jgi:tryptophan synthase alpha chain